MASLPAQQPRRPPVHRAFERLTEKERTLIALVYWSGLSLAEAAARLEISPATAKTHARQALARLADLLEGDQVVTLAP
jgi:RNA polymerase sigma factor (sigma-70 family)